MAALESGVLSVSVGGIPDAGKTTLVRAYADPKARGTEQSRAQTC